MKRRESPVVAVIPAYNEEQLLGGLLDQVLEQEYDDVYVLDDASTDNTVEAALSYGSDVNVVSGIENAGSGANRNRIIPVLGHSAIMPIIHFLDADVRLNSGRNPERARELVAASNIGFVGGLIRRPDGTQHTWNYGPAYSLPQMASSLVYAQADRLGRLWAPAGSLVRQGLNHWSLIDQWPDQQKEPVAHGVYWACEGNMVIPSNVFKCTGGYDPSLRYHEVMELAMKLDRLGLRRRFDPSIDVTHQRQSFFNKGYTRNFWTAQHRIVHKMGMKRFLTGKTD